MPASVRKYQPTKGRKELLKNDDWFGLSLDNHPRMQLLYRENQVPVLAPNDVAVLDGEAAELAGVEVLVVLRMGMAADELADVHRLHGVVAERQADGQVACVLSLDDVKSLHTMIPPLYNFFLMFVLRTLCFKTKNFTHLSMMFL